MPTIVTVSTSAASAVTIKPSKTTVTSVVVAPAANISLGQLKDLDVANIANGQAITYNSANGKYEGTTITTGAVTQLTGGRF
jgi:hypothetical protein